MLCCWEYCWELKKEGLGRMPNPLISLAGTTRLELATSGVTGRRSNQLNYDPAKCSLSGRPVDHPGTGRDLSAWTTRTVLTN